MTTNPVNPSAPPAAKTSLPRLLVLLGLLVLVIGAYAFDLLVAQPKAKAAEEKIQAFVDERNKKGVRDAEPVTSKDISDLLGVKPQFVEKHPEENYEIEYYCWWGPVPVFNTRRQFIAVVYYGINEPRRFSSHHRNEKPPEEALPIPQQPGKAGDSEPIAEPPTSSFGGDKAAEAPAAEQAKSGEEGKGPKEPEPAAKDAPAEPAAKDATAEKATAKDS